jgi:large subunit ribosomal protein L35Ae
MQARIANFRGGKHTKSDNHMIIYLPNVMNRETAQKYLNKKVIWTTQTGKQITGTIVNLHGNKGAVRVIFERGMPGQSVGTIVEVQ